MELASILQATRSPDPSIRSNAEEQIFQLSVSTEPQFFPALIAFASDTPNSVADCQSALLVLKNCIVRRWSPGFEQFTGPPLSHETRALLRESLLRLMQVPVNPRVRSACASVITRIGSLEFPDQWPDLVNKTVEMLFSPSGSPSASGGLVLFTELLVEIYREEDFMAQGEAILAQLLLLLTSTNDLEQKMLSIACFHDCVTFLLMGDDAQLKELDLIAHRAIPNWIIAFEQHLVKYITNQELVSEIANTIKEIDSAFPHVLGPLLPQLFNTSLELLKTYVDTSVGSQQGSQQGTVEDDTVSHLAYILELCLQNADVRSRHFTTKEEIARFSSLLVTMAQIPGPVAENWVDDYNSFVTSEMELETIETSARTYAAVLVASTQNPEILNYLLEILPTSNGLALESCLFLIQNWMSQVEIQNYIKKISSDLFQTFLNGLNFNADDNELIVARKIAVAAIAAKNSDTVLPSDMKLKLFTHGLSLVPHQDTEIVIFQQLRAIEMGSSLFPMEFKQYQMSAFQLIAKLLSSAEEDTPLFLTEIFAAVLRLDFTCANENNQVLELLFSLARNNSADVDLTAQVLDIVGDLLDVISSQSIVNFILQPVLRTIQSAEPTQFDYTSDLYFALELANAVFGNKTVVMSDLEQQTMLQGFYKVITTTTDHQILQVASFAYAALVKNLGAAVPLEAVTGVLQVAAKLLDPNLDDSAALASGQLVSAIIDKFGSELGSVQTELIIAVANRLSTAQNALLVETLVMVFCELVLRNVRAVVDILFSANMFEVVINQWLPTFEVVRGSDEIRKNVRAFQMLVDLNDPRLNALQVRDEPIREDGIMTRRRAKNLKYTMVSLPLKIVKVFVKELSQAPSAKDGFGPLNGAAANGTAGSGNTGEGDDSDWDDEFALNDEGEVTDFRTFQMILDWFKNIDPQKGMEFYSQLNAHDRKVLLDVSK